MLLLHLFNNQMTHTLDLNYIKAYGLTNQRLVAGIHLWCLLAGLTLSCRRWLLHREVLLSTVWRDFLKLLCLYLSAHTLGGLCVFKHHEHYLIYPHLSICRYLRDREKR